MKNGSLDRGVFILSLDFELAWGTFDLWDGPNSAEAKFTYERCRQTRKNVLDEFLALFKTYDISATWGIVGHLFLDGCEAVAGVKHHDIPRPDHEWFSDDWYAYDPADHIDNHPAWYGRDLVEKIKRAKPTQEIGCHTFSHVIFGDAGCSEKVAEAEVEKCIALAQEMDIELKSFIFPRHSEGHYAVLQKYGFSSYRSELFGWGNRLRGHSQRWAQFVGDVLGITPPTAVVEEKLPGLWGISSSAYFRPAYGYGRYVPMASRIRQGVKGIQKAIKNKQIFHLFCHPSNFGYRSEYMLDGLAQILQFAAQQREAENLKILTMAEMAAVLAEEQRYRIFVPVDRDFGGATS